MKPLPPGVGVNSPRLVRHVVAANNERIAAVSSDGAVASSQQLAAGIDRFTQSFSAIQSEWDEFTAAGGKLPLTEDLFQAWQGNTGSWWRSGLILLRGRACGPLSEAFPDTLAALEEIPGVLSAMWSVFGPGAELPEHRGDNAGGLRMLFGVHCPPGSGHSLDGEAMQLAEGKTFVFDDTRPHAAWNRSSSPRVLILADLLRPLPFPANLQNSSTQWVRHRFSRRYRNAAAVAAEWHNALNSDR